MCEQEKPTTEHQWLTQLVGEWEGDSECIMGPDAPPVTGKAKETISALGDFWIVCDSTGEMPGSEEKTRSMITIGYDPKQGKFSGSFVCNMMTRLWVYEGKLEGNKLTLLANGPSWHDPSKLVEYADELELVSPDHKILKSYNRENPAEPRCFMTMHYRRVKQ
jgi:hypothetical protein